MVERGLYLEELPQIERDSYLHFVTIALRSGHPGQRAVFRDELVSALIAAFALDSRWLDRDQELETARIAERRRRAFVLVDQTAERFDPVSEWPQFREAVWDGRQALMIAPAAR